MLRQSILLLCLSVFITAWGASARPAIENHTPWQSIGPTPSTILATIAADAKSHTIYVGSLGGGVIKSTDGGVTFRAVNNGLVGTTISGLAMSPTNPNVVYLNTQFDGFFKTVDGGAHWTGGDWGGLNLVMDPNNPNVMYGASGPFDYLLKTIDGGDTWSYAANGLGEALVFTIAIDPHDSNVIYAGSTGQGAFKSTDAGATWKPINADSNVNALLVDPDDSNIVYVGSDRHGVLKSIDGGRSFVRIGSPRVTSILSLAKSGQTLYAGTATQGVSESIDGGRTWRNSEVSPRLGNALSVDSQGSVYVGTNFEGAFVRSVSDSNWRRLGWDLLKRCACQNGDAIAIDPSDHDHVLFTTNGGGLLETEDGGRFWHDGGKHWQRRKFGPADIVVYGVAVDPVDHSIYATSANNGNGLWKSTDYGSTFARIDRAPGAPAGVYLGLSGRTVTVDPHHHRTVYFPDGGNVAGLWRSQDAGNSWIQVDNSDNFLSVTVDPTNSSIVYASASGLGGYEVLKSIDGGASFSPKSVGLSAGETANTGFLQVDPQRPNVLYLGTEASGLFKSTDAAESWFPINLGLGGDSHYDLSISGLVMDPESPDTLYAATAYHSVYKTSTGGR